MVLGIVTGSMPMLFSLLIMQGITLTMWRAFLDKAIPRFEGDKWRKNLDQMTLSSTLANLAGGANSAAQAGGGVPVGATSAALTMANQLQSSPDTYQNGNQQQPVDSTLKSLELLSKLDPSLLKLMDQLTKNPTLQQQVQSGTANFMMPIPPGAPPPQPGPIADTVSGGDGVELQNSPPDTMYSDEATTTSPVQLQYVQYNPGIGDPNNPVKYIEVSSDQAGNPQTQQYVGQQQPPQQYQYVQYVQQAPNQPPQLPSQQQYVYPNGYEQQAQQAQQPQNPQTKYEYIQNPEDPRISTGYRRKPVSQQQSDPNDEEEDSDDDDAQDEKDLNDEGEEEESDESDDPDKEVAESKPNMPRVIIGPPLVKQRRQRQQQMRLRKLRKQKQYKQMQLQRYLRLSQLRRYKGRRMAGMFGKPRFRAKRAIFYEPKLIYEGPSPESEPQQQQPMNPRNSNSKRTKSQRKMKPKSKNHAGFGGPYRFATPRYSMELMLTDNKDNHLDNNLNNHRYYNINLHDSQQNPGHPENLRRHEILYNQDNLLRHIYENRHHHDIPHQLENPFPNRDENLPVAIRSHNNPHHHMNFHFQENLLRNRHRQENFPRNHQQNPLRNLQENPPRNHQENPLRNHHQENLPRNFQEDFPRIRQDKPLRNHQENPLRNHQENPLRNHHQENPPRNFQEDFPQIRQENLSQNRKVNPPRNHQENSYHHDNSPPNRNENHSRNRHDNHQNRANLRNHEDFRHPKIANYHQSNPRIHETNYHHHHNDQLHYQPRAFYADNLNLAESEKFESKSRGVGDRMKGHDAKIEHISVDMSTDKKAKVKLKTKTIRLFDDDSDEIGKNIGISSGTNCSSTPLFKSGNNKLSKFWSSNGGWVGKCWPNSNKNENDDNIPIIVGTRATIAPTTETSIELPETTTETDTEYENEIESTTESTVDLTSNLSKEIAEEKVEEITSTSTTTTTTTPEPTTTTTIAPKMVTFPSSISLLDIAGILSAMTTERPTPEPSFTTQAPPLLTTTTSTTIVPMAFNPDSFMLNLNNFLKNYVTSTSTTTTTTTTTPSPPLSPSFISHFPSTTDSELATIGSADHLPKEFLDHILMVINASKIDNFQANNPNNINNLIPQQQTNHKKTHISPDSIELSTKNRGFEKDGGNQKENDEDEEDDEDDESDDNNDDLDWTRIHKEYDEDDNRVEGKIPARHRFKRVCYYLLDGGKDGQLDVDQLEMHICSHLIIGYARISGSGLVVVQNPLDDTEKYRRLTQMKFHYPKLKVLLSIGDLGGNLFSIIASTNRTRERFVTSVLDFCNEFNFDGVDIDWEFPSLRTGYKDDKTNFVLLLHHLRVQSNLSWKSKRKLRKNRRLLGKSSNQFIISVAVGAPLVIASTSYIIPAIAKIVDFVNLMSYDFHYFRVDRPYTGHHSPLYPQAMDNAYYSTLNVAWAATYWANNGMPLSKIVVGFPTYSRTYNLVVPIGQQMINVPATGPGIGRGKINYTMVCDFLRKPGTVKQFEIHSQVPFAYRNYDWIAYENEMSAAIKAQWVIKTGMGGIVTFALNFDDTKGTCRKDHKRFPLQKTISNLLELASIKSYKESAYVMKVRGSNWDDSGGSI